MLVLQPPSLNELCLNQFCAAPSPLCQNLPWNLKDQILRKLTRRGKCDDTILSWLLHPGVTELDLTDCVITDSSLKNFRIAKNVQALRLPKPPTVDRNHFSELSLLRLGERNVKLKVVSLHGLGGVSDRVIGSLVGGCPLLKELYIPSTDITDHALAALSMLTELVALDIAKTQVSDIGIQQLVGGSVGYSLRELRLDGCARLTDDSIESVCHYCTHLNILCFNHCPRLSEYSHVLSMGHMASRMKQLAWTVD